MKRHKNLWSKLISFENIYTASKKAMQGKSYKWYVLQFLENFEHNLYTIQKSLINKSYKPGQYDTFYIYEPKLRMISAAPFIDRIIHHCLVNIIGPIFENSFIHQSYANQIQKGTHKAIRDVQNAMRIHKYILHCDIRKYFPTIDHVILKDILSKKIKDPDILWLINSIIDGSNPQESIITYFPGDTIFTPIERRKGLPIGNLTSQFFANVYLNGLDHYVKEKLCCRYYARYVDDMIVVDSDKNKLWEISQKIDSYLCQLRIKLNPNKTHIRPVDKGIRFLGQYIYPNRRLLPNKNINRFKRKMKKYRELYIENKISLKEINHSLQSWLGHARQANTYSLRENILNQIYFRKDN